MTKQNKNCGGSGQGSGRGKFRPWEDTGDGPWICRQGGRSSSTGTPEELMVATVVEEQEAARTEAECPRKGLTLFTDGSRIESGAMGYAVA